MLAFSVLFTCCCHLAFSSLFYLFLRLGLLCPFVLGRFFWKEVVDGSMGRCVLLDYGSENSAFLVKLAILAMFQAPRPSH